MTVNPYVKGKGMKQLILGYVSEETGSTAIEYALIAAGIAVTIAATVYALGTDVLTNFYLEIAASLA